MISRADCVCLYTLSSASRRCLEATPRCTGKTTERAKASLILCPLRMCQRLAVPSGQSMLDDPSVREQDVSGVPGYHDCPTLQYKRTTPPPSAPRPAMAAALTTLRCWQEG